ncbi:hypothetical protein SUNI508_10915 [Seiridium unicorne]|uniref:Uncharacterized protein n=1 Tax=Seiridium unicorne TaxID=138068 RepID=A0ABR2UJI9_9PEZI
MPPLSSYLRDNFGRLALSTSKEIIAPSMPMKPRGKCGAADLCKSTEQGHQELGTEGIYRGRGEGPCVNDSTTSNSNNATSKAMANCLSDLCANRRLGPAGHRAF